MITLADVRSAADTIAGSVHRTPLQRSTTLSDRFGTNVYLKLELFQKTGSFKPRGAFNQVLAAGEAASSGIVGVSGGNFAQGLAYAGGTLGIDTVIVMPAGTPAHYVAATEGYGARVDLAPDVTSAFSRVDELAGSEGRVAMHPFDDPAMMAGDGTLGLEVVADLPELTDVFVSVGGGGLIGGVATAILGLVPGVRIWPVETEGADVLARSIAAGRPVEIEPTSLAKTLGAPYVAADTFALARERFSPVTVVSDAEAYRAMRFLMEREKVVTELAASCTMAALQRNADQFGAVDHVVLVLCGGNVSVGDFRTYHDLFDSGNRPQIPNV